LRSVVLLTVEGFVLPFAEIPLDQLGNVLVINLMASNDD